MKDAKDCLATFATAALLGAPEARATAQSAVDHYLSPHAHSPLGATAVLYELLDAFAELKIESGVAREIHADIEHRLEVIGKAMISGGQLPVQAEGSEAG